MTLTDITRTKFKSSEEINKEVDKVVGETFFFSNIKEEYMFWSNFFKNFEWPRWTYWFFWDDLWYSQVSCRIQPRNKWATDCIPRTYSDKVQLIPSFLYAAIVDYVEGEKCFEFIDWNYTEENKELARKIKEIYNWAKFGRSKKEKELNDSYPKRPKGIDWLEWINSNKFNYKKEYKKVNELERFINKKDDEYLTWIAKNHRILWT